MAGELGELLGWFSPFSEPVWPLQVGGPLQVRQHQTIVADLESLGTDPRVTQAANLALAAGGDVRVTQAPVLAMMLSPAVGARVTQAPTLALLQETAAGARATQSPVLVLVIIGPELLGWFSPFSEPVWPLQVRQHQTIFMADGPGFVQPVVNVNY